MKHVMRLVVVFICTVLLGVGAWAGAGRDEALLRKELQEKEATIWYLGHSGWAVKTRNHFLVFDYWDYNEFGKKRPSLSLEEGRIDPDSIADLKVVVFVSHEHGDHFDPVVLEWRKKVKDIIVVFGWKAGRGPGHIYPDQPRMRKKTGDLEVFYVNHTFDGIPESAFLVRVDGLDIYHSGDHASTRAPVNPVFKDNIDYLAGLSRKVDIAFISIFCRPNGDWVNPGDVYTVKKLKPSVLFPMHSGEREKEYREFAQAAKNHRLKTRVIAASHRGERFFFQKNKIKK